jgi:mannose-6-phosphate isomerase-like protein (cupin superfamily)
MVKIAENEFVGETQGAGISVILVNSLPGRGPSLHRHPYEEVFILQEGSVTFTRGDATVEAGAGEVVVVPPRTPHGFVNSGSVPLRMVAIHHSPKFITEWLD